MAHATVADLLDRTGTPTREDRAEAAFLARFTGNTLASYQYDVAAYRGWCDAAGINLLDITRGELERYVRHLETYVSPHTGRTYAQATVARMFAAVAQLLGFAELDEVIDRNPARSVRRPVVDRYAQHRTWLELGDLHQLCKAARASTSLQDRAVVLVMATVGLRVNELCQLNVDDLHIQRGQAYLEYIRKGGKITRPTISLEVVLLLEDLAASRTDKTGPLFLSGYGNRLTRAAVQRILTRLCGVAGVTTPITPHGMRRSFATAAALLGVPPHEIQEALYQADARQLPFYIQTNNNGSAARNAVANLLAG